ncbi:MAG: hypothetical protein L0K86_16360, partial [Actinomycetia bacterium]|nr:hypothetical protein [Actinomycetes bacterium]
VSGQHAAARLGLALAAACAHRLDEVFQRRRAPALLRRTSRWPRLAAAGLEDAAQCVADEALRAAADLRFAWLIPTEDGAALQALADSTVGLHPEPRLAVRAGLVVALDADVSGIGTVPSVPVVLAR